MPPFGSWNEVAFAALLAVVVVLATKLGSIGATVGGWLARKD
jgi:hypothetical protein